MHTRGDDAFALQVVRRIASAQARQLCIVIRRRFGETHVLFDLVEFLLHCSAGSYEQISYKFHIKK